jgi:hypothetical protein
MASQPKAQLTPKLPNRFRGLKGVSLAGLRSYNEGNSMRETETLYLSKHVLRSFRYPVSSVILSLYQLFLTMMSPGWRKVDDFMATVAAWQRYFPRNN